MRHGLINRPKAKMRTETKGRRHKVAISAHKKGDMHIKVGKKPVKKHFGSKKAILT